MHFKQYLTLNAFLSTASIALALPVSNSSLPNIFVSSYGGNVSTLQLHNSASGYTLSSIFSTRVSAPQPSWIEKQGDILYIVDEDFAGRNGSIAAYTTETDGSLTQIAIEDSFRGPVSEVLYNDGKGLATAYYSGSAIQSWSIAPNGAPSLLETFTFTLAAPGPNPQRQEAPHPHQVLVDPTGNFIVAPDLGADFLRCFRIDSDTSLLTELAPFSTPPGSGPRHGDFLVNEHGTFYFLLTELSNEVISYSVVYGDDGIAFHEISRIGAFGDTNVPPNTSAAEIFVSPDSRFILTSSRGATFFNLPPFPNSPTNVVSIPSDSLQVFEINPTTGSLTFKQLAPAGGKVPRHFSLSKDGKYATVGLQQDGRVVVIERNVEDGTFGDIVANVEGLGQVNCVIFDED